MMVKFGPQRLRSTVRTTGFELAGFSGVGVFSEDRVQQRVVEQMIEVPIFAPPETEQLVDVPKIVFQDRVAVHQESGFRCLRASDGGTVGGLRNFQFVDVFLTGEFSEGEGDLPVSEGKVFLRFDRRWEGDAEALPWPFPFLDFQVVDVLALAIRFFFFLKAWSHDAFVSKHSDSTICGGPVLMSSAYSCWSLFRGCLAAWDT